MSRLCCAPSNIDSQNVPSLLSPSPTTTKILLDKRLILDAKAIPTDIGIPCPREPVEASMPGTLSLSGWPPNTPLGLQKREISELGIIPISIKTAYRAKHPWPLLKIILSLFGSSKLSREILAISLYKTLINSTKDKAEPTWPLSNPREH